MATLRLQIPHSFSSTRAIFHPSHVPSSPTIRVTGDRFKRSRNLTVVTRAGPSAGSYLFAFVFPLSLLVGTIVTAAKIADKLDQDYLEELAINKALMAEEEDEDGYEGEDEDEETGGRMPSEEKEEEVAQPVLQPTRSRNRPKREA